jgi:serine phosphatase RsbU (regulator of sigma subunit)
MLIVFTDGVVDAADSRGGDFRIAGILDVVRQHSGARSNDLVSFIMDAATRAGEPADDQTVVVVRYTGTEEKPVFETHTMAMAAA